MAAETGLDMSAEEFGKLPHPSGSPEEYLEDLTEYESWCETAAGITSMPDATAAINEYVRLRLEAIKNQRSVGSRPILLLSGGLDSIHTLAVAKDVFPDVLAVTWHYSGSKESQYEVDMASRVARILGVEHGICEVDVSHMEQSARNTIHLLGTCEPWEVLAGLILRDIAEWVQSHFKYNKAEEYYFVSAAGADVLFMGGKPFSAVESVGETRRRWVLGILAEAGRAFTKERFIPDFYERLLGDQVEHCKVWQTQAALLLALNIDEKLVRGPEFLEDKLVLRQAAQAMGVPPELTQQRKSPMQKSSGGFEALVDVARTRLAREFSGRTYSNPKEEDLELLVSRLVLKDLHNE